MLWLSPEACLLPRCPEPANALFWSDPLRDLLSMHKNKTWAQCRMEAAFMYDPDFDNRLWLSSVPLVRLNDQGLPTGIASGCLIDYSRKRLLLTAAHATGDQGNWAIMLRFVPGQGTANYKLGTMNFLARGSLAQPGLTKIDLSYVEVPPSVIAHRQEIEMATGAVKSESPITVHTLSWADEPQHDETYGFCGMVMPVREAHFGQTFHTGVLRISSGLTFLRTEGDYHYFRLPSQHPGHEHFEGCSGAPVLSNTGKIVGLLCGGCESTNEVWAISFQSYKLAIDILVGNVR